MKKILCVSAIFALATSAMAATHFSAGGPNTIPGAGTGATTGAPASIYPWTIAVAGEPLVTTSMTVTLEGLSHTFPDDIDVLLVAPDGSKTLLMSDNGGSLDIVGISLTFADGNPALSDAAQLVSGTYAPSNVGTTTDPFPAPAPAGPYAANALSTMITGNVNGNWNLFITDDLGGDSGRLDSWSLTFVPEPASLSLLALGALGLIRRR